jgi:putative spermidine/putrescine transport system permease protein
VKRRSDKKPYILLGPASLILVALFTGGVVLAVVQSAGFFWPTGEHAFTISHYASILCEREFRASLLVTAAVAGVSTALSTVAGVILALALRRVVRGRRLLNALVQMPIAVPHLVMAVLLLQVISQSGLLARLAYAAGAIGLPNEFPILVNDRYAVGIIAAYVLKETPFIAVVALAMLARMGDEYEALASTLGASRWQRFRHVTLPLMAPAVVAASVVVFAFVFGAFEVPYLLGPTYPAMLGVVAQRRFTSIDLTERPDAIAVAVLMSLITAMLVWAYLKFARAGVGERPTLF